MTSRRAAGGVVVSFDLNRVGAGNSSGTYRIYTKGRSGAPGSDLSTGRVLIYSELPGRTVERVVPAESLGGGADLCVAYQDHAASEAGAQERCIRPL